MLDTVSSLERVIDVRNIEETQRQVVICRLFDRLDRQSSLQLLVDHDPTPLRHRLETQHGESLRWTYLAQGPDMWRVRLQRVPD